MKQSRAETLKRRKEMVLARARDSPAESIQARKATPSSDAHDTRSKAGMAKGTR